VQGTRHLEAIILVKFQFFSVLGAVNPIPELIKVKFGVVERTFLPNVTLIGATCRLCGAKNPKIGRE